MTLTDFLLARIAEDEEQATLSKATEAVNPNLRIPPGWINGVADRVLAECQTKRRIVERCSIFDIAMTYTHVTRGILADLATVYADHPDYREEWKP